MTKILMKIAVTTMLENARISILTKPVKKSSITPSTISSMGTLIKSQTNK